MADVPEEHDHGGIRMEPSAGALLEESILDGFEGGWPAHGREK
jgi:hypothetical protein